MHAYQVTFRDGYTMPINADSTQEALQSAQRWARATARINAAKWRGLGFRALRKATSVAYVVPMVPTGWDCVEV